MSSTEREQTSGDEHTMMDDQDDRTREKPEAPKQGLLKRISTMTGIDLPTFLLMLK